MSLRTCLWYNAQSHPPHDDATVAANSPMLLLPIPMEKTLLSEPEPQDRLGAVHSLMPEPVATVRAVMVYLAKLEVVFPQH